MTFLGICTDILPDRAVAAAEAEVVEVTRQVVVPIFNEWVVIARVYETLVAFLRRQPGWSLVPVDDGSTDGTPELLRTLLLVEDVGGRLSLQARRENSGKADAVASRMSAATSPRVFYMDGDLAYDTDCLLDLDRSLDTHEVAIGSRALVEHGRAPGLVRDPLRMFLGLLRIRANAMRGAYRR